MKGLLLIYLLVAVGAIGALRRPAIGLYVYVLFAVLRPHYLWGWAGSMEGISDIVGIALLISWLMHGLGSWRLGRGRAPVLAFGVFLVWSALSAVQAVDSDVAFASVVDLLKVALPFFVGASMLRTPAEVRTLLWIMVGAQAYISFEMNMSYLGGNNVIALEGYGGMDNNSFGISLVASIGIALGLTLSARKWSERAVGAASALLILHATLLTFSRGAFLGLLASGVTAFVVMPKRPRYIGALIVVLLIAIRLTGPELAARYGSSFAETEELDASAASRLDLWRDCFHVALTHPLFGVGPQNWPVVAQEYGWPEGKHAHSVWMQTMADVGFPGLLSLGLFYLVPCFALWRLARARTRAGDPASGVLPLAIVVSLAGYVTSAQFVSIQGLELPYYVVLAGAVLLKCAANTAMAQPRSHWPAGAHANPATPRLSTVQGATAPAIARR